MKFETKKGTVEVATGINEGDGRYAVMLYAKGEKCGFILEPCQARFLAQSLISGAERAEWRNFEKATREGRYTKEGKQTDDDKQ